ncbi:hypothetical protein [Brevifollis gellanilyticus]|uniref:Uncharacterized protein n=1 Tax=Brevifollis gellanilyticus TaxID=748831 RepID=A0A512MFN2_9BACT|nr:hypothetical protein [Brevifollis gellanilyticus]GEP45550.1 hypothetical protein BGE01nite_48410 [Brevifollis gellanilyticus]
MPQLYFMDHVFDGGYFTKLDEAIESDEVRLLFPDSWYWLHYCFFGRECICSEQSESLRGHLLNLVAMFYKHHDEVLEKLEWDEAAFEKVAQELLAIVEASRAYPISLWIYGDETSRDFLNEWRSKLPPSEQIQQLFELPHFTRMNKERLGYHGTDDKIALARYRNELANFNRRKKLAHKNRQREASNNAKEPADSQSLQTSGDQF